MTWAGVRASKRPSGINETGKTSRLATSTLATASFTPPGMTVLKTCASSVCTKAHDYGRFELRLDGKVITDLQGLDLYNAKEVVTSGELDGGRHELAAGEHKLEVRILTPNPVATPRNMFGLDFLKVEKK